MFSCECDRCGKSLLWEERFACNLLSPAFNCNPIESYYLCENCYQTIKEVLEDGEIK